MWIGSEMKIPLHQEDLRRPTLELSAVEPCLSAQLDFISAFDDWKHYWILKNLASQHGSQISSEKKLKQLAKISPKNYFSFFCCQKIYISMPHDGKIFRLCFSFFPENILFRLNCKLSKSPCFVEWKISKPNEH